MLGRQRAAYTWALPALAPPSLQNGIQKLIRLLEGQPESQFNAEQYMMLYT
jgi:hypothetical protein